MRVIDTSSLVKYFSKENGWEKVRDYMLYGVITVDLAIKEIANALWKKVLKEEMPVNIATQILSDLLSGNAIATLDEKKYLMKALNIAIQHKVTIYDALFIVATLENNLELITSDEKQKNVAEKLGIKVVYIP